MNNDDITDDDFGLFPSQDDTGGTDRNTPEDSDDDDLDPKEQIKRLKSAHTRELESFRGELETLRRNIPQQQAQPQNPYAFAPAGPQPDYEAELAARFDKIAAERGIGAAMADQTKLMAQFNRQQAESAAAPVRERQAQMAIEMYRSAKQSDPYWPVASKHFNAMIDAANPSEVSRMTPRQITAALDSAYTAAIGQAVVEKRNSNVPNYGGGSRSRGGSPFPTKGKVLSDPTAREALRSMREDYAFDEKDVAKVMSEEFGLGKGEY